jgi:hypothetical protein
MSIRSVLSVVAIVLSLISLEFYFVRQLFVAELFFAMGFGVLLVLVAVCYLLGTVAERGWTLMKQEARNHLTHPHKAVRSRSLQPNEAAAK